MSSVLAAASTEASNSAIISFTIYLILVFIIAGLANRSQKGKGFVSEYFLGSRNIGLWAFALTYAATAASGGSFMGFPALIYTHGWSLSWWIAGYMIVPIVALGLFAKRINQVGRIAGAITVPELLRKRFQSSNVGNVATLVVVFFMFFYLLAQFKAGAEIMATLLEDVPVYQGVVTQIESITANIPWVGRADGDYLLCLIFFAVAVIIYTAYGGFRAVVWTDVMQGFVMAIGVIILLVLSLKQTGGLTKATEALREMTPPEFGTAVMHIEKSSTMGVQFHRGDWVLSSQGDVVRVKDNFVILPGATASETVEILKITTESEIATLKGRVVEGVTARIKSTDPYAYGANEKGVYLTAPGPHRSKAVGFLPIFVAISFFMFWNFSGAGQPSYMVRQMSFKNTVTLRRSMMMVGFYFSIIYFPLVIIFTCARVLLPGMEIYADRVMPEMATHVTTAAGMPWLAGLLVAAPFAAVMSSVDSFLLLVSSGVVRDIYQQSINPNASEKTLKKLSFWVTIVVGVLAVIVVLNPPEYLQTLIIFASGGLGACFLVPMVFALYWPRMTSQAAIGGMISGGLTILGLYLAAYRIDGKFGEYYFLNIHPFIWAVIVTIVVIVVSSLRGKKPDEALIAKYFGSK